MLDVRPDWQDFFSTEPCYEGWNRFIDGYMEHGSIAEGLAFALESDRVWAVENTTSYEMFALLLKDEERAVRVQCTERELTDEEWGILAFDSDPYVVKMLAQNTDIQVRLRALWDITADSIVLKALGRNEAMPLALLNQLAKHENWEVRSSVINNPVMTNEALRGMHALETDPRLRQKIETRLEGTLQPRNAAPASVSAESLERLADGLDSQAPAPRLEAGTRSAQFVRLSPGILPGEITDVILGELQPDGTVRQILPPPQTLQEYIERDPDLIASWTATDRPPGWGNDEPTPGRRKQVFIHLLSVLDHTPDEIDAINSVLSGVTDAHLLSGLRKAAVNLSMDGYSAERLYHFLREEVRQINLREEFRRRDAEELAKMQRHEEGDGE